MHGLPFVFAAARQVDIEREFFPSRDQYVLRFRGMDHPVQVLSTNAISSSTLDKLGRPVTVFTQPGFVDLIFGNVQPVATCPPKAFGKAVAIAAVRLLLNNLVKKLVPMQIFLSSSNGMGGNFGQVAFSAIPG